ncbi:MAG: CRISPR-associated endonuclease Cas2 [Lyngbya sp.]|nr:CRISPR-associated endonuclease Cas2 [Lyngbya sp.]
MLIFIIMYDIPCNKRRKRVSDLLEGYGKRVQYSVFECLLTPRKYEELRYRLRQRVDINQDNLRFYPLSGHTVAKIETWGVGPPVTDFPGSIVV